MKPLFEIISEASRNEKRRNLDVSKKMLINGKSYNNIMCFAILSAENPDSKSDTASNNKKYMKELSNLLKRDHYTFVRQDGHYEGNVEHSYIIFNITQEVAAKLAGRFEQTSFFYCYPDGIGNIVNEYWEKQDTEQPYNSVKNPYIFINKTTNVENKQDAEDFYSIIDKDYKYSIDPSVFVKADTALQENIENLRSEFNLIEESNDEILNCIYNKTDIKNRTFRHITLQGVNLDE
jgi:hypothetical protein